MKDKHSRLDRISRRDFIKGSVVVVGAFALGGPRLVLAQGAKVNGGTLRISFSSIQQLDPYKTAGGNDEINASSLVFDTLVMISKDNFKPAPLLAKSWETSDDITWTFHLRQGVMFQDGNAVFPTGQGRELTANDVVYSINRFVKVSNAFTLGKVASVKALDKYTVQLTMEGADPFLVTDVNRLARVAIVPHEAVEKLGEDGFAQHPVGSGPFELANFTPNQKVTFKKNPNYWLPVDLDNVEFDYIPDPTVATISLEGGQIDVIPYLLNVDSAQELGKQSNIKLIARGGSYRGLGFNVKTAPFDELAVRDALSKAMDIDSAVKSVLGPYGQRAYGQVPPWVPFGYDPSLKDIWTYDPKAALAELAKAGFTEKTKDGILSRDGKPLSFKIKVLPGSQVRVLTILVTQLKQLGIDAGILQQDTATWASDLLKGNDTGMFFDFSYAGTTGLFELFDGQNIGRSNTHFYSNPKVDALFKEALQTVDEAKRSDLWKQAQRLIFEDRAGIPLYFEEGFSAVNKKVLDWVPPWGGLYLVSPENNVHFS